MTEMVRGSVAALSLIVAHCHDNYSNDDTYCNRNNNSTNTVTTVHKNDH